MNYATPVVYPQVQLSYSPHSAQSSQTLSHQASASQQTAQLSHQTVPSHIPHVGPLAHQNSYSFAPMHAISLAFHQPALQNQGILTHTQAIPITSNQILQHAMPTTTSQVAVAPIQFVYPTLSTSAGQRTGPQTFGEVATLFQPNNHLGASGLSSAASSTSSSSSSSSSSLNPSLSATSSNALDLSQQTSQQYSSQYPQTYCKYLLF